MITPIGSGASNEEIINGINNVIREINNNELTRIVKDETGTRRVLMGKGADGFYGMKVSKDGNDVYSAANDELIFNSNNNVFKIIHSGTLSVSFDTAGSTPQKASYTHNLGYTPVVVAYISRQADFQNGIVYPSPLVEWENGGTGEVYAQIRVYSNNIAVVLSADVQLPTAYANGTTWYAKYYIMQETAN